MLSSAERYVLSLLRRSLNVKDDFACDVTDEDAKTIAKIVMRNGILLTVYELLPEAVQNQLRSRYLAAVKQAITHDFEGEQVLQALSDAGLDCIALKGWELRKLYPSSTMRQMADLDYLIRPYSYPQISRIMESLEYSGGSESSWKHDNFKKGSVTVEMHKRLTDDSGIVQRWEADMWKRAEKTEGSIYRMSPEDYYIFHIIHLYKDFKNGSLGLRRLADTWLLQKQPRDMAVVNAKFGKMGLALFNERMTKLCKVCMGEEKTDENSELLLKHAFTYGIYGTVRSYQTSRIASMSKGSMKAGKLRSFFAAIFLPYSRMKAHFPILKKWPILLPFCWLKRIVHFLRGDVKQHRSRLNYSSVTKSDYAEMKRFFSAGGIDTKQP